MLEQRMRGVRIRCFPQLRHGGEHALVFRDFESPGWIKEIEDATCTSRTRELLEILSRLR